MRYLRRASAIILISLLLLLMGNGELRLSPIELAAVPYRYDLLTWEVTHLPDKWLYKFKSFLPWNSRSGEERAEDLSAFFRIGPEIHALEEELANLRDAASLTRETNSSPDLSRSGGAQRALEQELDSLMKERRGLRASAEETLESEVSGVLVGEGLDSRIGLIFPPVDVALTSPPRVLVVSLRSRIERTRTILLKPGMELEDMETLEEKIFRDLDHSALVLRLGGIATYPTIVMQDSSLLSAAIIAVHEWLHAYWFFQPLGWNIFNNPDMNTLNETAANLAGKELGERAYDSIIGQTGDSAAPDAVPQSEAVVNLGPPPDPEGNVFDFNREMRVTRLRVDELLAQGQVEQAEAYMEERRRLFLDKGFFIRKLNQAFFAFHGTYAAGPASVSPIGSQVEELRASSDSIGDFIRTIAEFGSYQEFLDYLAGPSSSAPMPGHPPLDPPAAVYLGS